MDESENQAAQNDAAASGSAAEAAKVAAESLKHDAEKTLGDIKNRGIRGFFSFDHMYFPSIANYLFVVIVLLSLARMVVGVLMGVAAIFTSGVVGGLVAIVGSVVSSIAGIFFTRIFFEMVLLGFKINEGIQEIRGKAGK